MFSPKVLYAAPWRLSSLMTLFVKSSPCRASSGPGSWADTMYCSFNTSFSTSTPSREAWGTYQHANDRVVVGVVDVLGQLLDDLEQVCDKVVVDQPCSMSAAV